MDPDVWLMPLRHAIEAAIDELRETDELYGAHLDPAIMDRIEAHLDAAHELTETDAGRAALAAICNDCDGIGHYPYQPEHGEAYEAQCIHCGGTGRAAPAGEKEASE